MHLILTLRMTFTSGAEIIAFTTNSAKLMLIPTTPVVVSFSLTSVGYYARNIPKWNDVEKRLTWAMFYKTQLWFFSESERTYSTFTFLKNLF